MFIELCVSRFNGITQAALLWFIWAWMFHSNPTILSLYYIGRSFCDITGVFVQIYFPLPACNQYSV